MNYTIAYSSKFEYQSKRPWSIVKCSQICSIVQYCKILKSTVSQALTVWEYYANPCRKIDFNRFWVV